jgi:hypothetical protein
MGQKGETGPAGQEEGGGGPETPLDRGTRGVRSSLARHGSAARNGYVKVIRKKTILWIVGGAALALFALALVVLLFGAKALKPRIEAAASQALHMDVHVRGRARLSFFPALGVSVANITVQNGGSVVATIATVKIGLKLLPLMTGRVRISSLKLLKPVVSIVRQKDGRLNIETERGKPSGGRLTLSQFAVSQGSLLYADLRSGGKAEWEGVEIAVKGLSAGTAPGGDLLKNLSLRVDFKCRTIKSGNYVLAGLAINAVAGEGVIDVRHTGQDILGGTGSGTLHADFNTTVPQFRLILAVNRLKIQDLLQASPNAKSMEGLADVSADLTGTGRTVLEIRRSLNGQVSLSGENIALKGLDIDGLISAIISSRRFNLVDVGAFFLAGPLGPVLTRSYHFADLLNESRGGKSAIAKLVSVWRFSHGLAEAVDVAMATKERRLAMKGGVNLADERFENAVVAVVDEQGCAVAIQKVHGPFGQPEIGNLSVLTSFTSPLAHLARSVAKLFDNKPCAVFYAGSVAPPPKPKKRP